MRREPENCPKTLGLVMLQAATWQDCVRQEDSTQ
jgi:hypothetical protein